MRIRIEGSAWPMHSALAVLLGTTAALSAGGATAQERGGVASGGAVDEVVVTGTRLRSGASSTSPITTTTREEIQAQGVINAEMIVRDLPSAAPGRSMVSNNNAYGASQVSLRNLGEGRTLVLVDGRRLVPSDFGGTVDVNAVPTPMIERVEVLTGGASAVYGSDAIAGVVNYILRDSFEGLEVSTQVAAFDEGDGDTIDASIIAGSAVGEGRGHIIAYLGYTQREPIYRRSRDWADVNYASNGQQLVPSLSPIIPEGKLPALGMMFSPNRTLVPYDGRLYNDVTDVYITTDQRRYMTGFKGRFELAPWAEAYASGLFSQSQVTRRLSEPSINTSLQVNYGNPLLSEQQRQVLFGNGVFAPTDTRTILLERRIVENDNFQDQNTYRTFQLQFGLRGDLPHGFRYDASAQYGETHWTERLVNDISLSRFQQGLLVAPNGQCLNPSGGCVPIDIFTSAPGAITPEQVAFFNLTQLASSTTTQLVATASISGDLGVFGVRSPWAERGVELALGVEYRRDTTDYRPDDNLRLGANVLFGAQAVIEGENALKDIFGEARAPLVEGRRFFHLLEVNGGLRQLDYKLAGQATSYGYGLAWMPSSELRLRGSFQRAVRAPTLGELFRPATPFGDTGVDPCFRNGASPASASQALCVATGVPAANYNTDTFQCPVFNCTAIVGGNIELGFERSNTKSFGVVWRPAFPSGLTASVDYYDVNVKGAIRAFGASFQNILNSCYGSGAVQNPSQDPNNAYCRLIARLPSTGQIYGGGRLNQQLGYVSRQNQNSGYLRTEGVDIDVSYPVRLEDLGLPRTLNLGVLATRVLAYDQVNVPGTPSQACSGTFGNICGQPVPKWRGTVRAAWAPREDLTVFARYRYVGRVILDTDSFSGGVADPVTHSIGDQSYVDVSASWDVWGPVNLTVGVNNVFDNEPPVISRVFGGVIRGLANTFPGTYDLGRYVFAGVRARF